MSSSASKNSLLGRSSDEASVAGIVDCTGAVAGVVAGVVAQSQIANMWNMHCPWRNKDMENKYRESTEISTRTKL